MAAGRLPDVATAFLRADALPLGPGVVAVSGGADSVALLRALLDAGAGPLHVAHFHHHLRGAESDADAVFVRGLADEHGCAFHLGGADVRAAGGNLEAAARRLRYDWLSGVAGTVGAAWVATGHTADDQAETVLHRLVRGTGLRGLRGIAPTRRLPLSASERGLGGEVEGRHARSSSGENPSRSPEPPHPPGPPLRSGEGGDDAPALPRPVQLVRPLLAATRADVLAYLAELGQSFRTDSSNADPRYTRNRIRADVLPLLRTFNPDVVAALTRAAEQSSEAFDLIDRLSADLLARAELPRAGELVVLDAAPLAAADPLLVRELFRHVWEREGWPTSQYRAAHWHRVAAVAAGDPPAADFPGGVTVRRAGRVVRLGRRS